MKAWANSRFRMIDVFTGFSLFFFSTVSCAAVDNIPKYDSEQGVDSIEFIHGGAIAKVNDWQLIDQKGTRFLRNSEGVAEPTYNAFWKRNYGGSVRPYLTDPSLRSEGCAFRQQFGYDFHKDSKLEISLSANVDAYALVPSGHPMEAAQERFFTFLLEYEQEGRKISKHVDIPFSALGRGSIHRDERDVANFEPRELEIKIDLRELATIKFDSETRNLIASFCNIGIGDLRVTNLTYKVTF